MTVGIVVVSHSRPLAEAAVALALQMVHDDPPPLRIAAGTIDGGLGTDATAVMAAIDEVDKGDGVVVFVDIGSALIGAIHGNDLPMVQTLAFIFAILIVLFNLIADVLYGLLDPRIRYD